MPTSQTLHNIAHVTSNAGSSEILTWLTSFLSISARLGGSAVRDNSTTGKAFLDV